MQLVWLCKRKLSRGKDALGQGFKGLQEVQAANTPQVGGLAEQGNGEEGQALHQRRRCVQRVVDEP